MARSLPGYSRCRIISIESGLTGVGVGDGVDVAVGVDVRVGVGVALGVAVGEEVGVAVRVAVGNGAYTTEVASAIWTIEAGVAACLADCLDAPHATNANNRKTSGPRTRKNLVGIDVGINLSSAGRCYFSGWRLALAT
jgi:hypothetical protein